jgi:hypothetical protein
LLVGPLVWRGIGQCNSRCLSPRVPVLANFSSLASGCTKATLEPDVIVRYGKGSQNVLVSHVKNVAQETGFHSREFEQFPQGGALATIGHVERAWGYSIAGPQGGRQLQPFQNAIGRILVGQPVGYAVKDFNERYAALSTNLSSLLEEIGFGAQVTDDELFRTWIERNDAQNYAVVGDPAVRLRVEDME